MNNYKDRRTNMRKMKQGPVRFTAKYLIGKDGRLFLRILANQALDKAALEGVTIEVTRGNNKKELEFKEVILVGDIYDNFNIKIKRYSKVVYDSKETLYRNSIVVDKSGYEVDQNNGINGDMLIALTKNDDDLEIKDAKFATKKTRNYTLTQIVLGKKSRIMTDKLIIVKDRKLIDEKMEIIKNDITRVHTQCNGLWRDIDMVDPTITLRIGKEQTLEDYIVGINEYTNVLDLVCDMKKTKVRNILDGSGDKLVVARLREDILKDIAVSAREKAFRDIHKFTITVREAKEVWEIEEKTVHINR